MGDYSTAIRGSIPLYRMKNNRQVLGHGKK